jgi:hypothetical protein
MVPALSLQHPDRRRRRSQKVETAVRLSVGQTGLAPDPHGPHPDGIGVLPFQFDKSERRKRWIAELPAVLDLSIEETEIVLRGGRDNRVMFGLKRLQDRLAALFSPPRSPDHLRKKLTRPFGGSEIRKVERLIRQEDTDQRDMRQIQPFRHHLRADQDVGLAPNQGFQNRFVFAALSDGVAVHPGDTRVGKVVAKLLFHPLRSDAESDQLFLPALRTRNIFRLGVSAVMTKVVPLAVVIRKRDGAISAPEALAAGRA